MVTSVLVGNSLKQPPNPVKLLPKFFELPRHHPRQFLDAIKLRFGIPFGCGVGHGQEL